MLTGYFAPIDFEQELEQELTGVSTRYGRLFLAKKQACYWSQNQWLNPQTISFQTISEATKKLRSLAPLWSYYPYASIRRGLLIQEGLLSPREKQIPFLSQIPKSPLGAWTLLDDHTLLCSPQTSCLFPHGEIHFLESKTPPSRAYLKLWEFFTRIGVYPKPNEHCLDLGASPGSWSWVLDSLGAKVIAIDRSPLAETVASLSNISFRRGDAFSIKDTSSFTWIFSDVACYPEKLLPWIHNELKKGSTANFVCTLKFQAAGNHDIIHEFAKIKGSSILHLFHNKHELTWYLLR